MGRVTCDAREYKDSRVRRKEHFAVQKKFTKSQENFNALLDVAESY